MILLSFFSSSFFVILPFPSSSSLLTSTPAFLLSSSSSSSHSSSSSSFLPFPPYRCRWRHCHGPLLLCVRRLRLYRLPPRFVFCFRFPFVILIFFSSISPAPLLSPALSPRRRPLLFSNLRPPAALFPRLSLSPFRSPFLTFHLFFPNSFWFPSPSPPFHILSPPPHWRPRGR